MEHNSVSSVPENGSADLSQGIDNAGAGPVTRTAHSLDSPRGGQVQQHSLHQAHLSRGRFAWASRTLLE